MELNAKYGAPHTGKVGMIDPDDVTRSILEDHPELRGQSVKVAKALVSEARNRDRGGDSELLDAMLLSEAVRSAWRVQSKIDEPLKDGEWRKRNTKDIQKDKAKAKRVVREGLAIVISRLTVGEVRDFQKYNTRLMARLEGIKPNAIVGDVVSLAELKKIGFK